MTSSVGAYCCARAHSWVTVAALALMAPWQNLAKPDICVQQRVLHDPAQSLPK